MKIWLGTEGKMEIRLCCFHLLVFNGEMICELTITEGNKQKRQSLNDPAFSLLKSNIDLLLKELLPPISCESNQPRTKKKHGGGFRDGIRWCWWCFVDN